VPQVLDAVVAVPVGPAQDGGPYGHSGAAIVVSSAAPSFCPLSRTVALRSGMSLPTPRSTLRAAYVRLHLTCRACLRQHDADLEALIASGRGDVPLIRLRWRCSECRSARIDAVVMSKDSDVVPW
jgi:hypothetical protein